MSAERIRWHSRVRRRQTFVEPPPRADRRNVRSRSAPASHASRRSMPAPPLRRRAAKVGIEERLGAHWAVIVGGVALALRRAAAGQIFDRAGIFRPGPARHRRLAARRRPRRRGRIFAPQGAAGDRRTIAAAPIPSVLTGAGTVAAFGSLYAAHALYGFIGPGSAFILMGAVGVATMFAAALHGPALAGLGLDRRARRAFAGDFDRSQSLAGRAVTSRSSARPPMVWRGCAAGCGWRSPPPIGAAIWQGLFLLNLKGLNGIDFTLASFAHLVVETALVIVAFARRAALAGVAVRTTHRPDRLRSARRLRGGRMRAFWPRRRSAPASARAGS